MNKFTSIYDILVYTEHIHKLSKDKIIHFSLVF